MKYRKKSLKKCLKVTLFGDKIKTKTLIRNLRRVSLHMNVFDICSKVYHPYLNIKRDINVQKVKVKVFFYCLFLFTWIDYEIINITR